MEGEYLSIETAKRIAEKDKEIESLNNLLKETSQTLSKQTTKAITLKSENERLNKELKSLQDSYDIEEEQANYHIDLTDDLREEVDRLNNIINEFDKLIENEINRSKLEDNYERVDSLEYCLATLKELKGSNKE